MDQAEFPPCSGVRQSAGFVLLRALRRRRPLILSCRGVIGLERAVLLSLDGRGVASHRLNDPIASSSATRTGV
jgi:hypothetical protein